MPTRSTSKYERKYLEENELILVESPDKTTYANVPAGTTDAAMRKLKREARARKRKKEYEDEMIALATEKPSPGDYAVAALVRGRAAIAKSLTPGDLKDKIDPADALAIQRTRTERAMKQDSCQQNKRKVTAPDLDWVLKPGKKDVPGIDAPGYCYKRSNGKAVCVQKRKSRFPKTCGKKR